MKLGNYRLAISISLFKRGGWLVRRVFESPLWCLLLCLAASPVKPPEYEMVVQSGHTYPVNSVAFSPNSRLILTASADDTARLWSIDGILLRVLKGHSASVNAVAFAPNGNLFATASFDKTVRIWHIDGTLVKVLKGHLGSVNAIAFATDSSFILTASDDNTVRFWALNGKLLRVLKGHSAWVNSVTVSPDSKYILTTSDDRTGVIWNSEGQTIKTLKKHWFKVRTGSFSADGRYIVTASWDHSICIWSVEGVLIKLIKLPAAVHSAVFSPDGKFVLTASEDNIARIVTVEGRLANVLKDHNAAVKFATYSPDGRYISTVSEDKTVNLWTAEGKLLKKLSHNAQWMNNASFSADDKYILVAIDDGSVQIWSNQFSLLRILTGHSAKVNSARFSQDGNLIVTASKDKTARVYKFDSNQSWELIGHSDNVQSAVFSPDGRSIVTASDDGTARLWTTDGKRLNILKGHNNWVRSAVFSPDGKVILTASHDGTVRLWNKDAKLLRTLKVLSTSFESAVFSGDGKRILTGSRDKSARLWSIDGRLLKTLKGHEDVVQSATFSIDDTLLVTASWDKSARLWNSSGNPLRALVGHQADVNSAALSSNKEVLVTTSNDNTMRIWSAQTGKELITITGLGDGSTFLYTPDGYWDASPNGGRLVAMVKGLEAFGVDQFAIRNNRPDIILERLGSKDKDRIEHFRGLYEARLRKFGITEADLSGELHAPEVKVLETKTEGKFAEVKFSLNDSKYDLHSYNIFANDVPLFANGKKIAGKSGTITERVELTSGENKIEVSVLNSKYVESIRALTFASYQPKNPVKGDLYFIGFGVSKYKDSRLNLDYAADDAKNMKALLSKVKSKGFREVYSEIYLNEKVTKENIQLAKKLVRQAKSDDTFILFISGHGKHDNDKEATYYYLSHDANLKDLANTAIKFEEIEDLLYGIAPRQKLFLMDTCESGETDEGSSQKYMAWAKKKGVRARAIPSPKGLDLKLGPQRIRSYLHERDRFIYNDLFRRSGAIVFSSSRGGEFSYEDADKRAGYFTRAIIDGLKGGADGNNDNSVTIDELKLYVSKTVSNWSDGNQNPTVDRDNIFQKFALPVLR